MPDDFFRYDLTFCYWFTRLAEADRQFENSLKQSALKITNGDTLKKVVSEEGY